MDSPLKARTVTFLAPCTDRGAESIADGHFKRRSFLINSRLFKKHLSPANDSVTILLSTINFSSTLVSMGIPLAVLARRFRCRDRDNLLRKATGVVYTCTFGSPRLTFAIVQYVDKEVPSYVLFPAAILVINYTGQKWSVGYHSSDWSLL